MSFLCVDSSDALDERAQCRADLEVGMSVTCKSLRFRLKALHNRESAHLRAGQMAHVIINDLSTIGSHYSDDKETSIPTV